MLIIGSYAGADVDPAWVHNLRANPRAHVEVGTDWPTTSTPTSCRATSVTPLYPKITAAAPGFADYQNKTSASSRCSSSCGLSRRAP